MHRGGLGVRRDYRVLASGASCRLLGNRVRVPPFGLYGGGRGAPAAYTLDPEGPEARAASPEFGAKQSRIPMRRDDVIRQETAGGGGFGDPLERDVEAVVADVENGYVTAGRARDDYGVVIGEDGADLAATEARRTELREARRG